MIRSWWQVLLSYRAKLFRCRFYISTITMSSISCLFTTKGSQSPPPTNATINSQRGRVIPLDAANPTGPRTFVPHHCMQPGAPSQLTDTASAWFLKMFPQSEGILELNDQAVYKTDFDPERETNMKIAIGEKPCHQGHRPCNVDIFSQHKRDQRTNNYHRHTQRNAYLNRVGDGHFDRRGRPQSKLVIHNQKLFTPFSALSKQAQASLKNQSTFTKEGLQSYKIHGVPLTWVEKRGDTETLCWVPLDTQVSGPSHHHQDALSSASICPID
jgi:hypothetical protein